jgi:hypothetical protein
MKKTNIFKMSAMALIVFMVSQNPGFAGNRMLNSMEIATDEEVAPSGWLNLTSMCSDDPASSRRWRVRNFTDAPVEYTWIVYGTAQSGSGVAPAGDSFFETATVGGPNTTIIRWVVDGVQYQKTKASGGAECETVTPEPVPCGTNLIVNGDFENGNTGFTSQYIYKVDGPAGNELVPELTYGIGPDASTYHPLFDGLGRSGKFMIVNGNEDFVRTVWAQSVNVEAGKEYEFSVYVSNVYQAEPANLRFTANDAVLGTFTPVIDGVSSWFNYTASYNAAFTGPLEIKIFTDNLTLQFGNDFGLDDISFKQVCPTEPAGCFASQVISSNQGPSQDLLTPVAADRSNPLKALFMPENDYTQNFFTLGFGGEIVLKFESPIKNGEGDDVRVIESTFGATVDGNCARYPETIRAFASQDGCNFIYLGEGCQDTDFDLGILGWAQYIKIVDISPVGASYFGTPIADGYDLDGVMCLNGYEENPVPADLTAGSASSWVSFNQGDRKDGNDVAGSRSNPDNALGMPQGGDVVNFVALGFGGEIVLKFNYVVFDNPLANDLSIIETSYNSPSCDNYPEKVMVEGSLDGENWITLTEELCLDGEVDINAAGAIQYIRIKDRSMASQFSNSADGYDVDGVVVINSCNDNTAEEDARKGDNINTPDEITAIAASPNPFKSEVRLELSTGSNDRTAQIRVFNIMGQNVYTSTLNVASSSNVFETISLNELPPGVYFVNVETESSKETIRLIKQ